MDITVFKVSLKNIWIFSLHLEEINKNRRKKKLIKAKEL